MGTLDGHLVAIDAKSGRQVWKTRVANNKEGYSITVAPLALKDRIVVGVGGGEYGIRGYITAHDAQTGREMWRFYTIPGPGEPGHETWEACPPDAKTYCDPEAWKHGGASVWVTGSFDPDLNLTYWGIGNAGPDYNADQRPGDNLYTASVVALDADTGTLRWHYQFTPHDHYDYDSVQVPVLADITLHGAPVKAMFWANRNGNFYVFDRATGRFLHAKPFVRVNWMKGFDANGRPIQTRQPAGLPTYPGIQGGTNWYSPSYSPRTKLMYVSTWDGNAHIFGGTPIVYEPGRDFAGRNNQTFVPTPGDPTRNIPGAPGLPNLRRGPINNWTSDAGRGVVQAIDPITGDATWKFEMTDVTDTGIFTTASDLLVTGGREGYLQAFDARTGTLLWKTNLGAQMLNNPITYAVNGKQYIAAAAGLSLFVFALP
jgi:alcohol dehydrogenase (cytochrome c)